MAAAPAPFSHASNPGLRVLPEVVSPLEAEALVREVDEHLLPRFGLRGKHAGDSVRRACPPRTTRRSCCRA